MFSAEQIYDALARSQAPAERLTKTDCASLTRVHEFIERLPAGGGVPVLLGALVEQEMINRFMKSHPSNPEPTPNATT